MLQENSISNYKNFMNQSINIFVTIIFILTSATLYAQPQLPSVNIQTKNGINVLSWTNPYTSNVASVTVQRSADSNYNFTTIGVVKDIATAVQSYADLRPLAGTNWYKVVVTFKSDIDWKSNVYKAVVDSADIAKRGAILSNDSIQTIVNKVVEESGNVDFEKINTNLKTVTYPTSQYIYTNPFTGNISIELPDVRKHNYSVVFMDLNGKEMMKIPRVREVEIILDKRNFQNSGTYRFVVFDNSTEEIEKGYITIY